MDEQQPRWQAIESRERRVLGVLVEKAKTTPDAYPLTLNSLRTGSNQKSNRFPQMELDEEQIEEACDNLRKVGAVTVIQGDGRREKYRHLAYEWFGVDKVELAVMAELLLRGAQTVGELRARAARMEPIKGLDELTPILQSLLSKNLIVYLSPPGRGAVVTHNLYEPRELEKVRRELGVSESAGAGGSNNERTEPRTSSPEPRIAASAADTHDSPGADGLRELREELLELRLTMQKQIDELRGELEELNRQLGN